HRHGAGHARPQPPSARDRRKQRPQCRLHGARSQRLPAGARRGGEPGTATGRTMTGPPPSHFDGRAPLFRIGATRLDPAAWIVPDERLAAYLDEKERLFATRRREVFAAEPDTAPAQHELLALLVEHLTTRFPALWQRRGEAVDVLPAGRRISLTDAQTPA